MPAKVMAVQQILFFDIDGTMLSTGGAGQRAMELALVEEFRIRFPFEGVLTAGRTDRGIADEIFALRTGGLGRRTRTIYEKLSGKVA